MNENFYVSKGTIAVCPYKHSVEEFTGGNLPGEDIVSRDICKDSSECPVEDCPIVAHYNAIQ